MLPVSVILSLTAIVSVILGVFHYFCPGRYSKHSVIILGVFHYFCPRRHSKQWDSHHFDFQFSFSVLCFGPKLNSKHFTRVFVYYFCCCHNLVKFHEIFSRKTVCGNVFLNVQQYFFYHKL